MHSRQISENEWEVAYELDKCPRCGATLAEPDDRLRRRCGCKACGITVMPASWTVVEY